MPAIMRDQEERCPECGGLLRDGLSCWDQLGRLCAWEVDDPALQAEHFLTVAAFNLQHASLFTDEALAGLRAVFSEYLDHGLPAREIRRRVGKAAAGTTRIRRAEHERRLVLRSWPLTIADVYLPENPAGAARRVRAWAASIREQL